VATDLKLIEFGSEDEVVFAKSADGVGPDAYFDAAPVQNNFWMMPFGLGYRTEFVRELKRLSEVIEEQTFVEVVFVDAVPTRNFAQQVFDLFAAEFFNAAFAR
jgi:hypothetical protein